VRDVGVAVAVNHRQVDDPLDAGLTGDVQGDQGLGVFVGHDTVQQEQRRDAGDGGTQRVDVEQVALDDTDPCREIGFRGIAHERAHIGATLDELFNNLAADSAGRAGYENGHDIDSLVEVEVE
jgi:hypothetical protein